MPRKKEAALRFALRCLKASGKGDIVGASVVSTDGYLLAMEMPPGIDKDRFSSMCASLMALSEQTLTEVEIGDMQQVMVMGSNGITVLTRAGSNAVLTLSTSPTAMQGRVLMQSKKAAKEVGEILRAFK